MFPLAILIPVLLAILRHQAQSAGLLQPDLGLLLHVLMSAGSMFAMIVWNANRIHSAQRIRESTGVVVADMDAQYRDIFAVLRDPVWVFSAEGELEYENGAARQFMASNGEAGLGSVQQSAVLSAAMLGRRVKVLELTDRETFAPRSLAIQYLRVLLTPQGEPGTIILVAHVLPPQDPQPLQSLLDAATSLSQSPPVPTHREPAC
jgi:PAS domain-containing protein